MSNVRRSILEEAMRVYTALGLSSLLLVMVVGQTQTVMASDYPDRAVRVIVNVTPGGGVDTTTRIVAQRLEQKLGQPFVIENRPSASGNTGAGTVFHASPDGYMLLASSGSPLALNGWIYKTLAYEPSGFEPISIMSRIPNVLIVRKDLPVKTVADLVSYAKEQPGKLTFASQGAGTVSHLTAELFMMKTGTKLVHVPYGGTTAALNDLLGGSVDISFLPLQAAYEFAKGGKLRILGVATEHRIDALPEVPTFVESGYSDFVSSTWNALSAPPGTPNAILQQLNTAIDETLHDKAIQESLVALQMTPVGGTLAETKIEIEKERKQWGLVAHAAGIQPQ
jgi:tripartite-type tricarboxylate transporter receptor subunit TctC